MTPHHNMKNIIFNTKETYLAYRSEWKAKYKNLSNEIRISPSRRTFAAAECICQASAERNRGRLDGSSEENLSERLLSVPATSSQRPGPRYAR